MTNIRLTLNALKAGTNRLLSDSCDMDKVANTFIQSPTYDIRIEHPNHDKAILIVRQGFMNRLNVHLWVEEEEGSPLFTNQKSWKELDPSDFMDDLVLEAILKGFNDLF